MRCVALEFAYTESPFAMQGMVMGMNHVTTGLGALIGSAFYNVVAVVTDVAGNVLFKFSTLLQSQCQRFLLRYFILNIIIYHCKCSDLCRDCQSG